MLLGGHHLGACHLGTCHRPFRELALSMLLSIVTPIYQTMITLEVKTNINLYPY